MTRIIAIAQAKPLRWLGALVGLILVAAIPAGWAADSVVLQLCWDHQCQFAGADYPLPMIHPNDRSAMAHPLRKAACGHRHRRSLVAQ